jgi:hypothetical protein
LRGELTSAAKASIRAFAYGTAEQAAEKVLYEQKLNLSG